MRIIMIEWFYQTIADYLFLHQQIIGKYNTPSLRCLNHKIQ